MLDEKKKKFHIKIKTGKCLSEEELVGKVKQ